MPAFVHVPLVLGEDGARLAKRHGAIGIAALRDAGWSAERIVGRLAFSAGLRPEEEPVAVSELVADFALDRLRREPARLTS